MIPAPFGFDSISEVLADAGISKKLLIEVLNKYLESEANQVTESDSFQAFLYREQIDGFRQILLSENESDDRG